jgi:hypothetical protein
LDPKDSLSEVAYSNGGHTIPLDVVDSCMEYYLTKHPRVSRPEWADLVRAIYQPHFLSLHGKLLMVFKLNEQDRKYIYDRNIINFMTRKTNRKGTEGSSKAGVSQGYGMPKMTTAREGRLGWMEKYRGVCTAA